MKYFVIVNLLAAIFLASAADKCPITDYNEVHVINKLPDPKLALHRASGDTELGYHDTTTNYDFN